MIKIVDSSPTDYKTLIKTLGQERVMEFYLGVEVALGRLYVSPLREDHHPTCSFYYTEAGNLRFNDFGTSDNLGVMDVIMRKFNITFPEACRRLEKDRLLIGVVNSKPLVKEDVELSYLLGDISHNLDYWATYGISPSTVERYNVTYVKSVYRNNKLYLRSTPSNPVYMYSFRSGRVKFYRPLSEDKKKKWYGNSDGEDIGGLEQLNPKGSICFITSSLKDVMVLRELGFNAVCLNGEGYGVNDTRTMQNLINFLRKRFRYVMFYMNNDGPGMMNSFKLNYIYRVPFVTNPLNTPKDPSDDLKKYGKHPTFRMLKKIISKKFKNYETVPF